MTYTPFDWTTATVLSASALNHLETQFQGFYNTVVYSYIPTTGASLIGQPDCPTPTAKTTTFQIVNTDYVFDRTRVITAIASNNARYMDTVSETANGILATTTSVVKTCVIPNSHTTGVYRITYSFKANTLSEFETKIYVNGVAAGSSHSILGDMNWWPVTTDITITKAGGTSTSSTGKEIQLLGWGNGGTIKDFYVKCDHTLITGY